MKLKYRNITVPYKAYDKSKKLSYYIYKNKEYTDYNELFTDFIGSYLTYHFEIKDKEKEVHNLSEVLEALLKHKEDFDIPKKYQEEYSPEEYKYITLLKKKILANSLKLADESDKEFIYSKSEYGNKKNFHIAKQVYEKYKKLTIPKKVHFPELDLDYYVVAGSYFYSIYHALDQVYDNSLYYQFGGTKSQNNRTHFHSHNFEELVDMVFKKSNKFKIHVSQSEFYSKQELEFLEKLSEKLKNMKFRSVEQNYDKIDVQEYNYLKDNKKYFSLLIHNIKYHNINRQYEKAVLKSHKI